MSAELFDAIDQQDVERVAALLAQGVDPNTLLAEPPYWRPLHAAIEEIAWYDGSIEVVRLLLQYGADANAWDGENTSTPLHSAMRILHADMQIHNKELIQLELIQLFLEAGADPNAVSNIGESALRWAVEQGDLDMAKLFLRFGADKTIDEFGGPCGYTPLTMAARKLDFKMIELLIAAGADPEALDEDGYTARERLPSREESNSKTWDKAMNLLSVSDVSDGDIHK